MSDVIVANPAINPSTYVVPRLPSQLEAIARYRNSCWAFASECVWTQDEVDKIEPVKKFPNKEHLKFFIEAIVNNKLLALVKHRRMMATWSCCVVAVWEVLFFEGVKVAIISKKEEDSDALVKKCNFIYENIPPSILPIKPRLSYKYTELNNLDLGGGIKGFAQGADQLRQHTITRIFGDEFGFWEKAEETWSSMKPTLEGGGSACLLSTRYPGFFQKIIDDTIDED